MKSFSEILELHVKRINDGTDIENCKIVDSSNNKNVVTSSNKKIIYDVRNEGNIFLKDLFRDFRKKSLKTNRKQKINFMKILKSDNKDFDFKTTNLKIPNNIKSKVELSEKVKDDYLKENPYKRFLFVSIGIILFFLIFGFKYFISEILQIPGFCDLKEDWTQFDLEVKNNALVQFYKRTCQDKCTFKNYLFNKVLQFDHFISALSFFSLYFKNSNLLNKKIVLIYIILFPFLLNVLKFVAFFYDKTKSYFFITMLNLSGFCIFRFYSKQLFLYNLAIAIPLIYFSFVRLFFEVFFIRIFYQNPEIHKITIPLLISLFRFLYFQVVLQIKILKDIVLINKYICVICPILFKFSFIGILHKIVEDDFSCKLFYFNILIDFLCDLNIKFQILKRIVIFMCKLFLKKIIELSVSEYEKIYIMFSIELEIFSIFIYFFLISFKYFNYAQNTLTDCFGTPLKNFVIINTNHFYLFGVLILYSFFKYFLKKLIVIILNNRVEFIEGYLPKLENKWHIFSYYIYLIFLISLYGYPGFYLILNLRNT